MISLPWIPNVSPQLKVFKTVGFKAVFKSGRNLNNILTENQAQTILRQSTNSLVIVESHISVKQNAVFTQDLNSKHEKNVFFGEWDKSGAVEHSRHCQRGFDYENIINTIKTELFRFQRKVRETPEIQRYRTSSEDVVLTSMVLTKIMASTSQLDFGRHCLQP